MAPWRTRVQKRVLGYAFPRRIAEYALESGMVVWGIYISIKVLTVGPMNPSLSELPMLAQSIWALMMMLGSATILIGMSVRRLDTIVARGLYLISTALVAYSVSVIAIGGWARGGTVAAFVFTIGCVCCLRGWWLRDREQALIQEIIRDHEGS